MSSPSQPSQLESPEPVDDSGTQNVRAAPPTLLVCADDRALAGGLEALAEAGLVARRTSGWGETLSLARELRASAVLLDSSFLAGAGPQLCAALRRAWGTVEVPILVLCRGGREVRRALAAGASDVAKWPVDWELVSRRLRRLIDAHRALSELESERGRLARAHAAVLDARRSYEQASLIDPLTLLPNRRQLERIVERALRVNADPVALLAFDVDRFSQINEVLGRAAGDELLCRVAEALTLCLRSLPRASRAGPGLTTLARSGGDEFTMLVQQSDLGLPAELAGAALRRLGDGLSVGEGRVHLAASVGIAVAAGTDSSEAVLQHAETAMHWAKGRGGAQFCFYNEELLLAARSRLNLDRRLREVFERGALQLHYQPVVAAGSRRVLGVEALLRWQDPDDGWIPPAEFIPVAEDSGLMEAIGIWVLETACRQLRTWLDDGLPPIRVAVNVSRCQLESGDFASEVARVLRETRLEPSWLELELSERGALRRDPAIARQLRKLSALGVRLVVDDFGTGETAIRDLRDRSLAGLKIDGSFVREDSAHEGGATVTAAMAAMARQLELHVVAEGVETEADLARVRESGCDAVQGYLLARPLPPEELRRRVQPSSEEPGACDLAVA